MLSARHGLEYPTAQDWVPGWAWYLADGTGLSRAAGQALDL